MSNNPPDQCEIPLDQVSKIPVVRKPLIVIPGVMGSILETWDERRLFSRAVLTEAFAQDLATKGNPNEENLAQKLMTEPYVVAVRPMEEYDTLCQYLKQLGYTVALVKSRYEATAGPHFSPCTNSWKDCEIVLSAPGKCKPNAFLFCYDWRQSNSISAAAVKAAIPKMREAMARVHAKVPFAIIGHSMGGIVGRLSIGQAGVTRREVDALITLGSPHNGSLDSIALLLGHLDKLSEPLPVPGLNVFYREQESRMALAWMSTYEMLPRAEIVRVFAPDDYEYGFVSIRARSEDADEMSIDTYFSRQDFASVATLRSPKSVPQRERILKIRIGLQQAKAVHQALEHFPSERKLYCFAGQGYRTLGTLDHHHYFVTVPGIIPRRIEEKQVTYSLVDGDETVPFWSALPGIPGADLRLINCKHLEIVSSRKVLEQLRQILEKDLSPSIKDLS